MTSLRNAKERVKGCKEDIRNIAFDSTRRDPWSTITTASPAWKPTRTARILKRCSRKQKHVKCGDVAMLECFEKNQTYLQTAHFFGAPSKLHSGVPSYSSSHTVTSGQLGLSEWRNAVDPPSGRDPQVNKKIPLSCVQIAHPSSSPNAREACCRPAH